MRKSNLKAENFLEIVRQAVIRRRLVNHAIDESRLLGAECQGILEEWEQGPLPPHGKDGSLGRNLKTA